MYEANAPDIAGEIEEGRVEIDLVYIGPVGHGETAAVCVGGYEGVVGRVAP